MNWTDELILKFLDLYRYRPCIWDPKHEGYKNRNRVIEEWNDIKDKLGVPCSVKDIKRKKESLMSAYRSYKIKIKKSEMSGAGNVYQPTWFAFAIMDSFLDRIYNCNLSLFSEDEQTKQHTEVLNKDHPSDDSTFRQEFSYESSQRYKLSNSQQSSLKTFKRTLQTPPEHLLEKKQMDQTNILNSATMQRSDEDDEECCIFGKLIAKKLSKLPEERRDMMMIKINQLFYDECHTFTKRES